MKIDIRDEDGVTTLRLRGRIVLGSGDVALRDSVLEALESGSTRIVIDLADVSTIDSSAIGELVAAYTTVANRGGRLKLANVSPRVNDILQITQLVLGFERDDDDGPGPTGVTSLGMWSKIRRVRDENV